MRFGRLLATVMLVATAAGCTQSAVASNKPVPIPSNPAAAFAAAKTRLGKESARFSVTVPGSAQQSYTGVADAKSTNWEITGQEFVVRRVGTDDIFLKMSGAVLDQALAKPAAHDQLAAGKWVRVRLPSAWKMGVVYNDTFPWNLANPAMKATDVKRTADRTFAGTLPLKDSKTAPITVDLDDQGRFARIAFGVEPDIFTYSDFGLKAGIAAPPAADVLDDDDPTILEATLLT
jgi:hypothetical protein